MSEATTINAAALEPLFEPWDEPTKHRTANPKRGEPAIVEQKRRPSPIAIVQNLRAHIRDWRESFYVGASDTTRHLLNHWFERPHRRTLPSGEEFDFRYYFCQREATEALIYLKEIRRINNLSSLTANFGGANAEIAGLGVTPDDDLWTRYAFKLATGAGKTKCMSLAMVWSYFHSLRESDSGMARHFVVIAPNLTVYERLKEDFGDGRIFDADPLIPVEWRGDWNMSVVLQDEAGGAPTGGVLYLTNIHRLYDPTKRAAKKQAETYSFMGPAVSRSTALDTGEAIRDRITAHPRLMVFNDEAHHVWDPDSAWNEAIEFLNRTCQTRGGDGIVAQLDYSATPKDDKGNYFKHIVCDTPLGEAVDGGVVKTPIIGTSDKPLATVKSDDAAYEYDRHLRLGYERWKVSRDEWVKSGKKALLFVMCADTTAADQIAHRFNTDETFKDLNGKTINLHTNLKGKVKKIGKGKDAQQVFEANEKQISDEDLKALRELSRRLDDNTSPYLCIVSVLMLREGWDVRNVTTIVPLRPYTSKAGILPEQTLGRGLRRMTAPGKQGAAEVVAVVEHPAFAELYKEQLAQEGLPIEVTDLDKIPKTTISIFPDETKPNFGKLDIELPGLAPAHRVKPEVENLTIKDVREAFSKYRPLPLGKKGDSEIEYEGRHLVTKEVVERMKLSLPLLESGIGAVSYYTKMLEHVCKVPNLFQSVGGLVQTFLEEVLFERPGSLMDEERIARLGDTDVVEHIRAVFVPLIRARTVTHEERRPAGERRRLSSWRPYPVTHSERRPAVTATHTLFNLVPCISQLEVAFAQYADQADDAAAFAKNAGPQCLRIDYIAGGGRLAFYTPDFFVRAKDGRHYLVETKGREDRDVPRKARAAMAWCEAASTEDQPWEYLYIPQGVFERLHTATMSSLADACRPALNDLVDVEVTEEAPLFASVAKEKEEEAERAPEVTAVIPAALLDGLPERYRDAAEQAVQLYQFLEQKEKVASFAPVFTALLGSLDEAANGLVVRRLQQDLPDGVAAQKAWFSPYLGQLGGGARGHYERVALNLKKTLVFTNGVMPIGLLRDCLDFALNDKSKLGGVFDAVTTRFRTDGARKLLQAVQATYDFRNTHVAHQDQPLTKAAEAKRALIQWVETLAAINSA